jgi:hypothetical protein
MTWGSSVAINHIDYLSILVDKETRHLVALSHGVSETTQTN